MVDFQSRDTRRGLGGGDDDDDEDDEGDEEAVADSADEAEDSAADETAEPVDSESDEADETAAASAEVSASESTGADTGVPEQTDDPLAAGPQSDDTPPEAPADSTDAATEEQAARSAAAGSKTTATPRDESTAQQPSNTVQAAVVTIGTAGEDSDPTGDGVVTALERAGHSVTARERLRGDFDGVQQSVDALVGRDDVDVVVTAGGTGIRAEEIAIEAVHPLLEKALPGFGEAFRTLLFDHVGTGIVAVRTTAGIANETPVFCLPGDQQAAALGVEEIVAPEAGELVAHLQSE